MALLEATTRLGGVGSETAKLWKDGAFQVDLWQDWPEDGALDALDPGAEMGLKILRSPI